MPGITEYLYSKCMNFSSVADPILNNSGPDPSQRSCELVSGSYLDLQNYKLTKICIFVNFYIIKVTLTKYKQPF